MRAVIVALALFVAGCSDDMKYVPPDLSSPLLYCPVAPPPDGTTCDATATPYCDYGAQSVTCRCMANAFVCGPLVEPDAGGVSGL